MLTPKGIFRFGRVHVHFQWKRAVKADGKCTQVYIPNCTFCPPVMKGEIQHGNFVQSRPYADRVPPVFVQVVFRPPWSLSSFRVVCYSSEVVTREGHRMSQRRLMCPGPLCFSYVTDYVYDCCPLTDPDVGPSVVVCDIEYFGRFGRKFVLCCLLLPNDDDDRCLASI